ncbi:MAG: chromate efflux transporter [Bacteroidota bacterium]
MGHSLITIGGLFLRLGFTAFGGPAAHIAMLEEEVVSRRKWMSRQHFLDLMGATNLIPGPNSTEMVMHTGLHHAGVPGMLVAGLSFILPAAGLTLLLAYFYVAYGSLPQVAPFLIGVQPAVLVIISGAIFKLGKKALKHRYYLLIGLAVMAASLGGINEVLAILAGGFVGMLGIRAKEHYFSPSILFFPVLSLTEVEADKLWALFLSFLKIGAILFGSGYVLVAYLEGELVEKLGWLTQQQLLDAIAAGQFTPGPVLTTATFIGYQIGGWSGAALATLGIFLPSFCFVALLNPLIPKLRTSPWSAAFLDAVNISAVGIMLAVLMQMGYQSIFAPFDWKALVVLLATTSFFFGQKRFGSMATVLLGIVLGYGLYLLEQAFFLN